MLRSTASTKNKTTALTTDHTNSVFIVILQQYSTAYDKHIRLFLVNFGDNAQQNRNLQRYSHLLDILVNRTLSYNFWWYDKTNNIANSESKQVVIIASSRIFFVAYSEYVTQKNAIHYLQHIRAKQQTDMWTFKQQFSSPLLWTT